MLAAQHRAHGVARHTGLSGNLADALSLSVQDLDFHLNLLN